MSDSGDAFERAAVALGKVNDVATSAAKIVGKVDKVGQVVAEARSAIDNAAKETTSARSDVLNAVGEIRSVEKEYRASIDRLSADLKQLSSVTEKSTESLAAEIVKLQRKVIWHTVILMLLSLTAIGLLVWIAYPSIKQIMGNH